MRKCRTTKEPLDPHDPDPPQFRTVILTVRVRAQVASCYDLEDLYLDIGCRRTSQASNATCESRWKVMARGHRKDIEAMGPGFYTRTIDHIDVETIDAAWEA